MLGQATWLDLIPGARQGVSYLLGQVANFQRLPTRFTQIETAAVAAKRAAESRGNIGAATQLALVLQGVGSLRDAHGRTSVALADVLEGVRTAGLGLTPVELGLLAAKVATDMAGLFKGTDALQASVYNVAAKVMTPTEVTQLKLAAPAGAAAPSAVATYGKYALIAAFVYGAILIGKRKRRHARS